MDKSFLHLEHSGWWILAIILCAVALSYLLYAKKDTPWNGTQNWILASLRFLAISLILLLLLSPSIRKVTNTIKKPLIAFAIDNSQSIIARDTSQRRLLERLEDVQEQFEELDMEVAFMTINDSTNFHAPTTNLTSLLEKVVQQTEDKNHVATLLATDGMYNRGRSPLYNHYLTPVFTLGLGDTIPPRDVSISRVLYNKLTFKGNETPIRLEISQGGYPNEEVSVQLRERGKLVAQQNIRLKNQIQEVTFTIPSAKEGLRRLVASVSPLQDESTLENNRSTIFMEVIDARKQVLIVASSPHPDIKAIRNTLEKTGNYQTAVYIPDIHPEKPTSIFDVVIFHGAFTSGVQYTPKGNPGLWYILSGESAITVANKKLPFIRIDRRGSQPDQVVGSFNQDFSKFKIADVSAFEEYPPIEVPFGEYQLSGPVEVLMYQKLGSVKTQKPLMVFYDDESQKTALLMGQNIWRWKLQEAAIHENSEQFENFITKTVQFLSVKNVRKQFRFKLRKNNFTSAEPLLFDAEVYNDIYERIYNNPINVDVISEDGNKSSFSFTDSEFNATFQAPSFPAGIYSYLARVKVGNKTMTDRGEFSIQHINPEFLDLTANHRLLKNMANKTGGTYRHFNEIDRLIDDVAAKDFKSVIKSEERMIPLYLAWWWYFAIFMLFSLEWFFRKYWGGY